MAHHGTNQQIHRIIDYCSHAGCAFNAVNTDAPQETFNFLIFHKNSKEYTGSELNNEIR